MTFQNIQHKIRNAQHLDFGKILDFSIKLFKEMWLKGFLMILVLMIFGGIISFLLVTIGLIPNPYDVNLNEEFSLFGFYGSSAIDNILQTLILTPFSLGMLAGFYRMCRQVDLKETQNGDMFYFFRGEHLKRVFVLGLIYALIASVAQALFLIPYLYAFIPLSFFSIVFANNPELTETEIVKLSFNLGTKKWLITFGSMFVTGILGMLGIIACGIGLLFTISIVYLPVYFIYRDVVGFEDEDEIQYIGEIQDL
ncbi:hypothetical protein [uncultured Psychroserpens sp.]|uniref:hypothetical protein n=1 Tax=uncultured Psychroserpens sp. TaxID=255436 RepID=UPI00260F1807|nr:hypothetical protein [uncultured Psychroserpens sp.]